MINDVDEGAAGSDRGQLSRIPHQNEPLDTLERIEQGSELLLREHRALVDDDGLRAFWLRSRRVREVPSRCSVEAFQPVEELGEGLAVSPQSSCLLEAHARLPGWGKQQDSAPRDLLDVTERSQQGCLARPCWANEHAEPRRVQLLQCRRLLTSRAHLGLPLVGVAGEL